MTDRCLRIELIHERRYHRLSRWNIWTLTLLRDTFVRSLPGTTAPKRLVDPQQIEDRLRDIFEPPFGVAEVL